MQSTALSIRLSMLAAAAGVALASGGCAGFDPDHEGLSCGFDRASYLTTPEGLRTKCGIRYVCGRRDSARHVQKEPAHATYTVELNCTRESASYACACVHDGKTVKRFNATRACESSSFFGGLADDVGRDCLFFEAAGS